MNLKGRLGQGWLITRYASENLNLFISEVIFAEYLRNKQSG